MRPCMSKTNRVATVQNINYTDCMYNAKQAVKVNMQGNRWWGKSFVMPEVDRSFLELVKSVRQIWESA